MLLSSLESQTDNNFFALFYMQNVRVVYMFSLWNFQLDTDAKAKVVWNFFYKI